MSQALASLHNYRENYELVLGTNKRTPHGLSDEPRMAHRGYLYKLPIWLMAS